MREKTRSSAKLVRGSISVVTVTIFLYHRCHCSGLTNNTGSTLYYILIRLVYSCSQYLSHYNPQTNLITTNIAIEGVHFPNDINQYESIKFLRTLFSVLLRVFYIAFLLLLYYLPVFQRPGHSFSLLFPFYFLR